MLKLQAHRVGALRLRVEQGDVGPLLRQRRGNGFPNAACRAGDGKHLAAQAQPVRGYV